MSFVYILLLNNQELYVGFTADLNRRLEEHQLGRSGYTSKYLPVKLLFYEAFTSEVDARRREKYLKTSKGKSTIRMMLRTTLQ
ncbi:MAG: GIY-YIG nuclease family protein [Candidatus Nomurabacteria bacterium]|nr:MAG: GIY-YIG nuclease family protein [Candidatus Nomurabacteria bacterium]